MSNVTINPANGAITVRVACNSLQSVSFSITIYQPDGNTVAEYYNGSTQTANPFDIVLPQGPATYNGDYVAGTIKMFDPAGAGNPYDIEVSILQNNAVVSPIIQLQGKTKTGVNSFQTIFHLN